MVVLAFRRLAAFCLLLLTGAAVLPALTFFLTSIVYLLLVDIGLICGDRRRVLGFEGGDYCLHQDMRKMKAKLLAMAQYFFLWLFAVRSAEKILGPSV